MLKPSIAGVISAGKLRATATTANAKASIVPDEVHTLIAAFDKAWETIQASGVVYPEAKAAAGRMPVSNKRLDQLSFARWWQCRHAEWSMMKRPDPPAEPFDRRTPPSRPCGSTCSRASAPTSPLVAFKFRYASGEDSELNERSMRAVLSSAATMGPA